MIYEQLLPFYQNFAHPILVGWFNSSLPKDPAQFNFDKHAPVLSSPTVVWTTIAVYFSLVLAHFVFRGLFNTTARVFAAPLQMLFFLHNVILSAVSLVLLGLMIENLLPNLDRNGVLWTLCSEHSYESDHRLEFFYYLNYFLKFYELLDTVLLVLKGKKLDFLHYYHHAMTLLLCFSQLRGRSSVSWLCIVLNLAVHVVMYYYYARTAISNKKIWWKKHLTTMQILQFVLDLVFIYIGIYLRVTFEWDKDPVIRNSFWFALLPRFTWSQFGYDYSGTLAKWFGLGVQRQPKFDLVPNEIATCYASVEAAWMGWGVITSYLLLFLQFFFKTYSSTEKSNLTKSAKKASSSNETKKTPSKQSVTSSSVETNSATPIPTKSSSRARSTSRSRSSKD